MAGKKLLVADDSLTIQKVIRLALSNEGYEIQAVSDGNDAIQQISVFRPDVILIDVSLPNQSAFEIKNATNGIPDLSNTRFILMSSAFERVDEEEAARVGFHGRLTKPFDPAHLRQVLTEALGQVSGKATPTKSAPPTMQPDLADFDSLPASPEADELMEHDLPQFPPPAEDDEFSTPVKPMDLPYMDPLPEPPEASIDDEFTVSPPSTQSPADPFARLSPPPLPGKPAAGPVFPPFDESADELSPVSEESEDSGHMDVRKLTESTLRMSGLDDFQWSVNESARKAPSPFSEQEADEAPAIRPFGGMSDLGGTTFQLDEADSEGTQGHASEARYGMPPFQYGSTGETSGMSSLPGYTPPPPPSQAHSPQIPAPSASAAPAAPSISAQEIEEMVQKQVRETLTRMTQELLPKVAERVIKEEIHRMLQELP